MYKPFFHSYLIAGGTTIFILLFVVFFILFAHQIVINYPSASCQVGSMGTLKALRSRNRLIAFSHL